MALLVALVYPEQATAEEALNTAKALDDAGWLSILAASRVTKDEHGKIKHHDERHNVRTGAVAGVVLGGLTGLIFAVPVIGLAAGGAVGAYLGKSPRMGPRRISRRSASRWGMTCNRVAPRSC